MREPIQTSNSVEFKALDLIRHGINATYELGLRYKEMIDHRSYPHNLSSCEIKARKKFRPERDSNP